jgi:hypothetical protein
MNSNSTFTYFLLIAAGVALAGYVVWHFSRANSLLHRWADENGFQILQSETRTIFAGPFTWTSSRNQIVYFVRVRDREGRERSGWLRCGSFWSGIFSDKTEIRWKDES